MTTESAQCGPVRLGVWVDDPPSLTLTAKYIDALRALELDEVVVMLDGPKPGLNEARWGTSDLALLAAALPNVRRILSVWPVANAARVADLVHRVPSLLGALGADELELDIEPIGWVKPGIVGYNGAAEAGRELVGALRHAGVKRIGVTTFPSAIPSAAGAIALADVLALQVYPVATHAGVEVRYDGPRGPARLPREALEAARKRFPNVELVAGLPAYRQSWPGHTPREAMGAAAASSVAAGVNTFRYWSAKHIVRLAPRKYAAKAIAALRA